LFDLKQSWGDRPSRPATNLEVEIVKKSFCLDIFTFPLSKPSNNKISSMPAKHSNSNSNDEKASFPPPLIPSTIQARLDTGNIGKGGGQKGSLMRCAQKYGALQSKVLRGGSSDDADAVSQAKEDLEKELSFYQLEVSKLCLMQKTLLQQVEQNQEKEEERLAEIASLTDQVQKVETEASATLETRKCCQEYEALAKLANDKFQSLSRADLEQQIQESRKELERLHEEETTTDHLLKTRAAQFQLLMQYMLDLKESINDKEEEAQITKAAPKVKPKKDDATTKEEDPMDVVEEEDGLYGDL
jgi:hypothetical protein